MVMAWSPLAASAIEPWPPFKSIVADVIGSRGEPVIYRVRARRADPRSSDGGPGAF
jgi:hypothetical protein